MNNFYKKEFIKDNLVTITAHGIIALKGFIIMPLIIKFVGINIYGGTVLLQSMMGFIFGISSFGIGIKMKRYLPSISDKKEKANIFYNQFILRAIIMLTIILIWNFSFNQVNKILFKDDLFFSFWIIAVFLPTYFLYSQAHEYFRYTSRILYMSILGISYPIIYIILLLILRLSHNISINSIITAQSVSAVIVSIPAFLIIFKEIGIKWYVHTKNIISEIKLGFPLILNFLMDFVLSGIDRYIIAVYLSTAAVGNYSVGYQLGSAILLLPKAMGTVLPQLMSKSMDNTNDKHAINMVNNSLKLYLLIGIPIFFCSIILGSPIIALLANEEVASKTVLILPIITLGSLFFGLFIILSDVLFVHLKTKQIFRANITATIFNLFANIILLFYFRNIMIAAITTFFSYLIAFLYIRRTVNQLWKIDYQISIILKSTVASLIMFVVLTFVSKAYDPMSSVFYLGCEILLGVSIYVIMLFILKGFTESEIITLKNILRLKG